MVSKTLIYNGFINMQDSGEAMDIVFLGNSQTPLAEILQDEISGHQVSARYYISDTEKDLNQVQVDFIKQLSGEVEAEYLDHYSEITGYLWTDENLQIGGHDLMAEIKSNAGKYLNLIIDIND
jgi:hypothetical protein